MKNAKIITVSVESTENGLLRATSEEMVGLHVVAEDEQTLKERTREMLTDLFLCEGQNVTIFEAEETSAFTVPPWVAVPREDETHVC